MGPDSNTQITTENPISLVNQKIDFLENQMVEMYGNKRYKSADGFTQEEIYAYAGAMDCVATLTLTQESAKVYGKSLTVVFFLSSKRKDCS